MCLDRGSWVYKQASTDIHTSIALMYIFACDEKLPLKIIFNVHKHYLSFVLTWGKCEIDFNLCWYDGADWWG